MKRKIAERIRELRINLNLSQEGLAFKSEIDRTFMNRIEKGNVNISMDTLTKIIEEGLQTTMQNFFNNEKFQ